VYECVWWVHHRAAASRGMETSTPSTEAFFLAHCRVRIEAKKSQLMVSLVETQLLTLEELLAGILLEEGFVGDGTGKVIDHEFEDRLNLIFSVTRIMC
jgi:hypothetical protein